MYERKWFLYVWKGVIMIWDQRYWKEFQTNYISHVQLVKIIVKFTMMVFKYSILTALFIRRLISEGSMHSLHIHVIGNNCTWKSCEACFISHSLQKVFQFVKSFLTVYKTQEILHPTIHSNNIFPCTSCI